MIQKVEEAEAVLLAEAVVDVIPIITAEAVVVLRTLTITQ
jgi:hypothetical protein